MALRNGGQFIGGICGLNNFRDSWTPKSAGASHWVDYLADMETNSAGNFVAASSQYLSVTDASYNLTSAVSVVATVKNIGDSSGIVDKSSNGSTNSQYMLFVDSGVAIARVTSSSEGNKTVVGTTNATSGTHQLALSYDGVTLRLYVDGVSEGVPISAAAPLNGSAVQPMQIGALVAPTYFANGQIESVGIFSKGLSQAEVQSLQGRKLSTLSAGERTSLSFVNGYLDNAQASLTASVLSSVPATNNNTVTVGAGAILTPAYFGSNISRRIDRATGNVWTQAAYANRPTLRADGLEYGSGKYLETASPVTFAEDFTHFVVYSPSVSPQVIALGNTGAASLIQIITGLMFVIADNTSAANTFTPATLLSGLVWMCMRRSAGLITVTGSGGASATIGTVAGNLTLGFDGARHLAGQYTDADSRIQAQVAYPNNSDAVYARSVAYIVNTYGAAP